MRIWLIIPAAMFVLVACSSGHSAQKQDAFKLSEAERQLLDMTNAERKKADVPPLKAGALLFRAARDHSKNMARQEKLEHDLDGKSPFDRLDDVKYEYRTGGENIGMSAGDTPLADVFKLWMESENHRANMLSTKYTEIGLGIAKNAKGDTYVTQVFATPLK